MPLETMNVSLPSLLKRFVEQRVEDGGYSNTSEYVRDLIRRDQERLQLGEWSRERLEHRHQELHYDSADRLRELLQEGLDSGPPAEMTQQDWQKLREQVRQVGVLHGQTSP